MSRCKKIFNILLIVVSFICIFNSIDAATITASASGIEVGKSVTITVNVPNVNTVDLTAIVTGAGVNNKIRLVDGSMTGDAKDFSKSITVTPTSAGTITVTVSSDSNAVLNGNYVGVSASKSITVKDKEEPKKEEQTQKPTTTTKPNTTTTNTNKKPTTTTTTTKKPTTTTKKKSTNADVIGLTVNVEGLSPKFDKDKTSYKLKVGSDVEKLRLGISLDDSRATYRVTGNKNFKIGENIVKIIVTAEDAKTTKTYKIVVDKEPDLTLESLTIENGELTKEFDAGVLEYNLKEIDENVNSLKINAVAKSEEVKVTIEGNEKLVAGENIIKVIVSTEDNKYSKTYTLKVNKTEAVPTISDNAEEIVEENSLVGGILGEDEEKVKQNITIIALYLLAIVEFVQVVYLYKQLRAANPDYERITRKKDKEEEQYKRRRVVDIEIDDSKNEENK